MIHPQRMKQALAVAFATAVLTAFGHAGELSVNGGFEDTTTSPWRSGLTRDVREFYAGTADAPFNGWAFGGRWERGEYAVSSSEQAHTGVRACQITCVRKGRGGIASSPVTLAPGSTIEVTCWLKARDADGGRVFLNFEGTPGDGWASKDLKTGTYDWTRFTLRTVVPESKTGGPHTLVAFLYTTCEGSLWVDDFSIQLVDAKAAVETTAEVALGPKSPAPLAEPADSRGYRVNVVSPLEKVFREDDFSPAPVAHAELTTARNEYESLQLVVEAPWRPVSIRQVTISDFQGPGGAAIPGSAASWDRVGYVEITAKPSYFAERGQGSYPDPLLPAGAFAIEGRSRAPLWITLRTPKDCPPGRYTGTITVTPDQLRPTTIPVTLTVWDFTLTDQTHLRTMTWLNSQSLREWYGHDESPQGQRNQTKAMQNYATVLLEHRLGPGGNIADHVERGADGRFDFHAVDATLQPLIAQGMNAFIMGTAPNLGREHKTAYSLQFTETFTAMLKAYGDHLREKDWLNLAYIYVYDEAPRAAWPEVKKINAAIHAAVPHARILQCLNEPEGVRELTGSSDVFDVYVQQYHKTGVAESQKKGAEAWLATCCYPMEHPNFFIEYPLLDLRVTPWICWKYQAAGFEYWSPNSWGGNTRKQENGKRWPEAPWAANTFGNYNGDGYLLYPGANLKPYSSLRFEALRDGLEDYEYLWTLNTLLQQAEPHYPASPAVADARRLLSLEGVVKDTGSYSPKPDAYLALRRHIAETILALKKLK
jgi:hypothetical protein